MEQQQLNELILFGLPLNVIGYILFLIIACAFVAWRFWLSVEERKSINDFIKKLEEGEEYD